MGVQSSYEGPLDGSLYARVVKRSGEQESSSGDCGRRQVINSPHTVSMDSGISSAGNGLQRCTEYATSSAGHANPTNNLLAGGTSELDRLLDDMLMTVRDIPDLGQEIPYHARMDSRPFTYGHLSSPGLVRKATPPPARASPAPPPTSPDFHEG